MSWPWLPEMSASASCEMGPRTPLPTSAVPAAAAPLTAEAARQITDGHSNAKQAALWTRGTLSAMNVATSSIFRDTMHGYGLTEGLTEVLTEGGAGSPQDLAPSSVFRDSMHGWGVAEGDAVAQSVVQGESWSSVDGGPWGWTLQEISELASTASRIGVLLLAACST
jgi:hypothetical protein